MRPLFCVWLLLILAACAAPTPEPTPTLERPTPRPTLARPLGTAIPVTKGEGELIETEPGPVFVIISTVDEHGLPGAATLTLFAAPDPTLTSDPAAPQVPSGTFAQVLEVRRLAPDYLRSFYKVAAADTVGWVSTYYAQRTVYLLAFDPRGCACPFTVPFWGDAALTQKIGDVDNLAALQILALAPDTVQVQVLRTGNIGWLRQTLVRESVANDFILLNQP